MSCLVEQPSLLRYSEDMGDTQTRSETGPATEGILHTGYDNTIDEHHTINLLDDTNTDDVIYLNIEGLP